MTLRRRPSVVRYLAAVGSLNLWFFSIFLVFIVWLIYLRVNGERSVLSHYSFLFVVPLASGTGLISAGRRGHLDLLLGAGERRSAIWWTALVAAWCIPAAMIIVVLLAGAPIDLDAMLVVRALAVFSLTGAVSFAVGLIETRLAGGVVWLVLRLTGFMSPAILTVKQLEAGMPTDRGATFLAILLMPEVMLGAKTPMIYLSLFVTLGLIAFTSAYLLFVRIDFPGRR